MGTTNEIPPPPSREHAKVLTVRLHDAEYEAVRTYAVRLTTQKGHAVTLNDAMRILIHANCKPRKRKSP